MSLSFVKTAAGSSDFLTLVPVVPAVVSAAILLMAVVPLMPQDALPELKVKAATRDILTAVHDEVKEMPAYPGEPFIRMDVFIGEDDDDTNKDIHSVLLAAKEHGRPALRVQIDFMRRLRGFPVVWITRGTESFLCIFMDGGMEIGSKTLTAAEVDALAPGLLKAVRDKKRILRQLFA